MVLPTRRSLFVLLILVSVIYASRPDRYMASSRTTMESATILPSLSSSSTSGTMVHNAIHSSKTTSEAYLNNSSWSSSTSYPRVFAEPNQLIANEGAVKESQGNVTITGNAANVELLVNSKLTIGVNLDRCHSQLLICYDADPGSIPSLWAQSVCHSASQCALSFQEDSSDPNTIWINDDEDEGSRKVVHDYAEAVMKSGRISYFGEVLSSKNGCAPKINNGVVVLRSVVASDACPVTIRHAKIKPVPAPNTPTDAYGNVIKPTTQEASTSSLTAWQIVVISIVAVICATGLITLIYCIVKDLKKKEQPVKAPPPKSSLNHANEDYASMVASIPEFAKLKAKASKNKANKKTKSKRAKKSVKATKKVAEVEPAAATVGCLPPPVLEPAVEICKEPVAEPLPEAKAVAPPVVDVPKEKPLLVDVTQEDETKKASKKKKKAKKAAPPLPARTANTSFEAAPQPTTEGGAPERELSVDVTQEYIEPTPKAERKRVGVPTFCYVVKPEEGDFLLRRGDIPHPSKSRSARSEKKLNSKPSRRKAM